MKIAVVTEDEVRRRFDAALKKHGGTRGFASAARVSPAYVSRVKHGHLPVAGALAKFLGVEFVRVYRPLA